jgi:hypothetical protein
MSVTRSEFLDAIGSSVTAAVHTEVKNGVQDIPPVDDFMEAYNDLRKLIEDKKLPPAVWAVTMYTLGSSLAIKYGKKGW